VVAGKSTGTSQTARCYNVLATQSSLQNRYKNQIRYFNTYLSNQYDVMIKSKGKEG
jgi:hypothetical protein